MRETENTDGFGALLGADESASVGGGGGNASATPMIPDDLVDEALAEDQESRLRMAFENAKDTDPDKYAQDSALAERTGLPLDTVERNRDEVIRTADDITAQQLDALFQETRNEELLKFAENNAKLIHDMQPGFWRDIRDTLYAVPEAVGVGYDQLKQSKLYAEKNFRKLTPQEVAELESLNMSLQGKGVQADFSSPFRTGVLGAAQSTPGIASSFVAGSEAVAPLVIASGVQGALVGGEAALVAGQAGPQVAAPEEIVTVPATATAGFFAGAVRPFIGGHKSVGAKVFKLGQSYDNFLQMSGQLRMELEGIRGVNGEALPEEVMVAGSVLGGGINALLENELDERLKKAIPGLDKIANPWTRTGIKQVLKLPGAQKVLYSYGKKIMEISAAEGITEGLQELTSIFVGEGAKIVSDAEFKPIEFAEAAERVAESAYVGTVGGGVLGSVVASPSAVYEYRNRDVRTPEQVQAMHDKLQQSVTSNKLYQRSPSAFRDLVSSLSKDEKFYVNAEAAMSVIESLSPEQQTTLFNAVPDLKTEIETAMQSGADIAITKADYSAYIAPFEQAKALRDYIKLDPADMSVAERDTQAQFFAENPDLVQSMRAQAKELPAAAPEEMVPQLERIFRKSMTAAGINETEARSLAPLYAKTIARMSAPFGLNAVDELNSRLVAFQSVGENGVLKEGSNLQVLLGDLTKLREGKRVPGLNEESRAAVEDFGARLEAAGLSPQGAERLSAQELYDALYPGDMEQSVQQEQPALPEIDPAIMEQVQVGLSAATDSIPVLRELQLAANEGDAAAHSNLNAIAINALRYLTSGLKTARVKFTENTGLFGGEYEPSLALSVTFDPKEKAGALAALAQFAQNFNQKQVHVRQGTTARAGEKYADGSYTTPVFTITTPEPLTREQVENFITVSGIYGVSYEGNSIEAYFVGNPDDRPDIAKFISGVRKGIASLGGSQLTVVRRVARLWPYGYGEGAIPYESIQGDISPAAPGADDTARLIAERLLGRSVTPQEQARTVTPEQSALQRRIAAEYDFMPDNDMENPNVRRAYEELASAIIEQYRALPLREVEAHVKRDKDGNVLRDDKGDPIAKDSEPYENSRQMREDVQGKNRMTFYATTPNSFGPPGADFSGHPLLEETEFRDKNGYPLLVNDVLRVVHDYFAHGITPSEFGPKGEEAAWRNHMATISSPWARWALTSETRGQNSWVNFRKEIYGKNIPLKERGFARQKAALLPIEYSLTGDEDIDTPVMDLMETLAPEEQNGSVSAGQRDAASLEMDAIQETRALAQSERGYITLTRDLAGKLRKAVVSLTSRADFSTGVHEFSHWAVAMHREFAAMARERLNDSSLIIENPEAYAAVKRILDDWEKLKEYVGAETDDFSVEAEEKIARMFEAYMRDGSAPSESLRRIFARFRDWLVRIYKDVFDLGEVDPEVRGIFDRWLASEEEIAKVREKNSFLAEIAQNLGLANIAERVADYINSATINAEEKLYRELTKEENARGSEAYKEQFAKLRVDVAAEFAKQPEYMVIQYMKDNGFKIMEGPETQGIASDILSGDMQSENTVHPDVVADLFGYESGMALLRALKKTPEFDRAVDNETRKRLMEKFPDMVQQGKIKNHAVAAIVNDRVLLALDLMIKELNRSVGGGNRVGMKQFAAMLAQEQVAKMKISEINYAFRYEVAREKSLREALKASRAGKAEEALIHLQRSMVNQAIFKSLEYMNEVRTKANDLFARVDEKDKNLAKGADIDFVGAARHILQKYGIIPTKSGEVSGFNIQEWLDDIKERDPDIMNDLVAMSQIITAPAKAAKDLTIAEYMDIYHSVENIFWVARKMKEFEIADKRLATQAAVGEMVKQLSTFKPAPSIEGTQVYGAAKFRARLMGLKAVTRRVEFWVNSVDGKYGGPMRRYIWEPISNASSEYRSAKAKWMKDLNTILKRHKDHLKKPGKISTGMFKVDRNGKREELVFRDRLELVGFLLHTGNLSNLDKLLGGYGIEIGEYTAAMQRLWNIGILTGKDYKIAQELWDLAEGLKPLSQRAHKQLYGYRFDEIESTPITTPAGVFRGGYWPAVVDYEQVDTSNVERAMQEAKQFAVASTNKGFTKGRVQGFKRPLNTSLRLASNHIDQVLKFSYMEPSVRQVARVINNQDFKDALKSVDTAAYGEMLMPWLQRAAQQITTEPGKPGKGHGNFHKAFRFLRVSSSAQAMMGNILNALQNITGFSVAAHDIGVRNVAKGFVRYMSNPLETGRRVRSLSKFMETRQNIIDVDVSNEISDIVLRRGYFTKFKNASIKHGYIFQRLVQGFMDNIIWSGAFDKAIAQGMKEEQAILYADSIIRTTQSSLNPEDISAIEAGTEGQKLFLMFYSYFNTMANKFGTDASTIMRQMGWSGAPQLFYLYMMIVAIPALSADILVRAMKDTLPDDDDDDGQELDDWMAWFAGAQGRYVTASVPYAGNVINSFINLANDNPMDDRISASPVFTNLESVIRFTGKTTGIADPYSDQSRMVRDGLTAIGFITGLPLGQLGKPVGFAVNVNEGDEEPEGATDYLRGFIGGPKVPGK